MEDPDRSVRNQGLQNIYCKLFLLRNEVLNTNIHLTIYKASLIRSVVIYACFVWKLTADNQSLGFAAPEKKNKVPRTIYNSRRHKSTIAMRLSKFRSCVI